MNAPLSRWEEGVRWMESGRRGVFRLSEHLVMMGKQSKQSWGLWPINLAKVWHVCAATTCVKANGVTERRLYPSTAPECTPAIPPVSKVHPHHPKGCLETCSIPPIRLHSQLQKWHATLQETWILRAVRPIFHSARNAKLISTKRKSFSTSWEKLH